MKKICFIAHALTVIGFLSTAGESLASGISIKTTGSVVRGYSDRFDVTAVVSGIDAKTAQATGTENANWMSNRLKFKFKQKRTNVILPFDTDDAWKTNGFYIHLINQSEDTDSVGNKIETVTMTIIGQSVSPDCPECGSLNYVIDTTVTPHIIPMTVYYDDGTAGNKTEPQDALFTVINDVPNAVPSNFTVGQIFKGIGVAWDVPATVAYLAGTYSTPTSVGILIIEQSGRAGIVIPGKTFQKDKATDVYVDCHFNPNADQCVSCGDSTTVDAASYIDFDGKMPAGVVASAVVSTGKKGASFNEDLDVTKTYAVLAQYAPSGVKRTACSLIEPGLDETFSEAMGEQEATTASIQCFVATAAYGTPWHKNLNLLRWFRDKMLRKTSWGRDFIEWYYVNGPWISRWVAQTEIRRAAVRAALWTPVQAIATIKFFCERPCTASMAAGSIAFVLIFAFSVCLKRRRSLLE